MALERYTSSCWAAPPGARQALRRQGHTPIPRREEAHPGHRTERRRIGRRTSSLRTLPLSAALSPGYSGCKQGPVSPMESLFAPSLSDWGRGARGGVIRRTPLPPTGSGRRRYAPSLQSRRRPHQRPRGPGREAAPHWLARSPHPALPDPSRRSPGQCRASPAIGRTHPSGAGRLAAILRPRQHRAFSLAPASQPMGWTRSGLGSSWQPAALRSAFKSVCRKGFVSFYFSFTVSPCLLGVVKGFVSPPPPFPAARRC